MPPTGVLLTGGTGFVGMQLLARYLERTERPLYAIVRAEDEDAAQDRLRERLSALIDPDAFDGRLIAVPGDVEEPGLGLSADRRRGLAREVGEVVHAAASVSFDLPLHQSRRINVEGTRHMLDFARGCPSLERFAYISTAYVAGDHPGEFAEGDLEVGQEFRNPYEQSKFEAERLVRRHRRELPIQIFRPSIIVGEAESGWTDSFNVLYAPLRAYSRGNLPFLPADLKAPVDVVPVDYVADAVFVLAQGPVNGLETYHLVAGRQATTVEEIVRLARDELERPAPLVVPASLYRRLMHPLLLWRSDSRRRRALERMETFFPYFTMRVRYRNDRTRRLLEPKGVSVKPFGSYFGQLMEFAEQAAWGKRRLPAPA